MTTALEIMAELLLEEIEQREQLVAAHETAMKDHQDKINERLQAIETRIAALSTAAPSTPPELLEALRLLRQMNKPTPKAAAKDLKFSIRRDELGRAMEVTAHG